MAQVIIKNILLCFLIEILSGVNGKSADIADTAKVYPKIRAYGDPPRSKNPTQKWEGSSSILSEKFGNSNLFKGRNEVILSAGKKIRKRSLYGGNKGIKNVNKWQNLFYGSIANGNMRSLRNRRLRQDQERRYLQDRMADDDFISNRVFFLPGEERFKPKNRKSHNFRNSYNLRTSVLSDPFKSSRSVRMFRRMKNKLHRSRTAEENRQTPDIMNVEVTNDVVHTPKWQYKCKTGTTGVLGVRDGRTVSSRGLTYSEDDGNGVKSLLCRAETTEMFRPDDDTFVKNSVSGLNVVTTDYDPFRFLERGNEINNDVLEIGSKAVSALESTSRKNQSVSVVSAQDRDAESQSRVSTKFVYENNDRRALHSKSDVQGSTSFNITNGKVPLVLTGKQESSSLVQNSKENFSEEKNDKTVTFMNYKKKIDFDIAFRNLFDY